MAKEDVEVPERPPAKRRQLEAALDLWLAVWLDRSDLTPSERRRVEEEKARRKTASRRPFPVVVGFTGTREGMTPRQRAFVMSALQGWQATGVLAEAHHGDCEGADEQFHGLCRQLGVPVVLHPPSAGDRRAWCEGAVRTEKALPFLERNKEIVRAASVLIATPKEGREPAPGRGQGTWSTVRYARSRGGAPRVVMPDGSLLAEGA